MTNEIQKLAGYNKAFFDEYEDKDMSKIINFSKDTGIFVKLYRNPPYSPIDCEAVSVNGNRCSIELKSRNDLFDTIFIEPSKYNNLMLEWQKNNKLPLYINFIGNEVYIFDLRNIQNIDEATVNIYNQGKGIRETVKRYLLPIVKAYKFRLNKDNKYERVKHEK